MPSIFEKTPCIVALELDYSRIAIQHCYVEGMSAGDLVMAILNLGEDDRTFEIYDYDNSSRKEEDQPIDLEELREETYKLWKKEQCKKCWKNKASHVSLPCCHLAVCGECCSNHCIICDLLITDWIKIYIT